MKDPSMTKTELAREIAALKKRIQELELTETERTRMEVELVVSKKRLSRAEIISRCGNWEFNLALNRVFASEGAFNVYGLVDQEWTIPEVQKIPLPEYRPMLDKALQALVNENSPYDVEFKIKRPDTGEIIDIHSVAEYDRDRNVVFGVIQDITERKLAEEALKESKERLNTILNNVGAYIYLKDTQYRYTYVNNKVCNLFGFKENEIVGKGDTSFFLPVSVEEIMKNDRWVIEQGETVICEETCIASSDNVPRTYWVVKLPLKDSRGNICGLCGISTDITDLKRAEEALKRSESRLSSTIEFLPDATFVIDLEGRIVSWNRTIEEMTGFSAKMMLGKGNYEYSMLLYGQRRPLLVNFLFSWNDDIAKKYYSFIKKDGDTLYSETDTPSFVRGQTRTLWCKASLLRDERGEVIGAIESIRDITERKGIETEREKLILELQEALNKVKTLSGLLPICASCKKIRNDKGHWEQMEIYIRDRSEAEFSHGICPECAQKLYPEYLIKE